MQCVQALLTGGVRACDVAVISMYEAQRKLVVETLTKRLPRGVGAGVFAATVDSVQGREYDFIILTLVRSNAEQKVGFISNRGRANVALSRARYGLIIVGDSATVGCDPLWGALLQEYASDRRLVEGTLSALTRLFPRLRSQRRGPSWSPAFSPMTATSLPTC